MADISVRTEGMVGASADYYQDSEIFAAIQNAQALEYDRIESNNKDLALQLSPLTATWGLIYWEERYGLPIYNNTDYETRRPAVLAKMAKNKNFSAEMVYHYVHAYGTQCSVTVDVQTSTVKILFTDGTPTLLPQLKAAIESVVHAHLGVEYRVFYTYETLSGLTHEELAAYTHEDLEIGIPV